MFVPPHIDEESGDLTALFREQNTDIIMCPVALKRLHSWLVAAAQRLASRMDQ